MLPIGQHLLGAGECAFHDKFANGPPEAKRVLNAAAQASRRNIKLYIEVLSWMKILRDAEMRNKVFFHKLGI